MTYREFRRLCLSLPEAEEIETWGEATFRVKARIFAIGSPEGRTVSLKASLDDQAGLVAMDPKTFAVAAYTGRFGWVNVSLTRLGAQLGARLVRNAWERTAPRRLVRNGETKRLGAETLGRRRAGARSKAGEPRR